MRRAWPEGRHGRALALLVLGVVLLHGLLLGGLELPGSPRAVPLPSAVQVRRIVAPPLAADRADAAMAPAAKPSAQPPPQKRASRSRTNTSSLATTRTEPPANPPASEPSAPIEVAAGPASRPEADANGPPHPVDEAATVASAPTASASAAAAPVETAWPVYATRMPPPVTLRYELQRGALVGSGELRWQPQGEHYTLQLQGSVLGLNVLAQLSQGDLDAAGVAPQRFTDQRLRRSVQAANFQREAGKITFSGPGIELPLVQGVQDRLSWMIQMAAIAAAEPARWVTGARITLQVVGARGDAGTWTFRSLGAAAIELAGAPGGPIETLHFLREPRGPYDTMVEVWLDPQRHHLPAQASLRSGAEGDNLELRLREFVPGP